MKPTNDIPTGTDLLIEKIDDLIEVIKYLTATIKKDRRDPEHGVGVPEDSSRPITDRAVDNELTDLSIPLQSCYTYDREDFNHGSSVRIGTRGSDIAYSDMILHSPCRADSTIINSVPHEHSMNRVICGIDTGINSAGRDCSSTEVYNERG